LVYLLFLEESIIIHLKGAVRIMEVDTMVGPGNLVASSSVDLA
jgi:hypothetical protein